MISIVMPLYNASRFLNETLDSIEKQTHQDYELICIDDGSTDETVDIIKFRMNNNYKIKLLVNDENKGAGYSRNRGIDEAKGEYIQFLDGDDIFDKELLEKEFKLARTYDLDIAICNAKHVESDKVFIPVMMHKSEEYKKKYCMGSYSILDKSVSDYSSLSCAAWDKLYKLDFIRKHKLYFQNIPCCNDVCFVEMAYCLASRIMELPDEKVMIYVRDHNTISRISTKRNPIYYFEAPYMIANEMQKRGLLYKYEKYLSIKLYLIIRGGLFAKAPAEAKEEYLHFLVTEGFNRILVLFRNLTLFRIIINKGINKSNYSLRNFMDIFWEDFPNTILKYVKIEDEIYVWGSGKWGEKVLNSIKESGIVIKNVFDSDLKKIGTTIENYEIEKFDAKNLSEESLVIVAVKEDAEIVDLLELYKIRYVSIKGMLDEYLPMLVDSN